MEKPPRMEFMRNEFDRTGKRTLIAYTVALVPVQAMKAIKKSWFLLGLT